MSLPYSHSLSIHHNRFLKMASTTLQVILSCVDKDRHWTSVLMIVQNNGERIDVSCAAQGRKSTHPVGATDQPMKGWPRNSCYRFPTKFHGIDMWGNLKKCLHFGTFVPVVNWLSPNLVTNQEHLRCNKALGLLSATNIVFKHP